ncbi:hypothetical protein CDAR_101891 [Caerostris darwini]|uniref:Uncharacterized protein n=1 Tax=Caerostris darwini TaxID=1538125 RepID=A0AAV4TD64_9ARAC|nr:hypothetical protein CDAR_101891 [Caerostris darwini]
MNTWELSGGIRGQDTFHESRSKIDPRKTGPLGTGASYFLTETEMSVLGHEPSHLITIFWLHSTMIHLLLLPSSNDRSFVVDQLIGYV